MAKPILVIKTVLSDESKKEGIEKHWAKATDNEYHVICVGVKPNYAVVFPIIEVYGVPVSESLELRQEKLSEASKIINRGNGG